MKKLLLLLVFIFLSFMTLGCKRSLKYQYVGAYVNLVENGNPNIDDENIKIYYDFNTNTVTEYDRIWQYGIRNKTTYRNINDVTHVYDFTLSFDLYGDLDSLRIYPIIYKAKDDKYQIITDEYIDLELQLDVAKVAVISRQYRYNKQDYTVNARIRVTKKEG